MIDDEEKQRLINRYRHMMVDSGMRPSTVSDEELLGMFRSDSLTDTLNDMRKILSLVPETYWKANGL